MFMVQHLYSYGWDDADWCEDGKPLRFATREGAQEEILQFVRDANRHGQDYVIEEFRVIETKAGGKQ